jgi:putative membrane protein
VNVRNVRHQAVEINMTIMRASSRISRMTGMITFAIAASCLSLPFAGTLFGQGMNRPQQYPPQTQTPATGEPGEPSLSTPAMNTMSDAEFAEHAAEGGAAEVKLGQLAQEKGSNDAVKDFGKMMVNDHTEAGQQLKTIAAQQNLKLPDELNKHDQGVYNKISKLSGEAFDRAYAKEMVNDHRKDIDDFQQEASGGQNQPIKNFAAQTLPTLQKHLKSAREMQRTVSRSGGSKGGY